MADAPKDTTLSVQIESELRWLETQLEIGKRIRNENTALIEAYEEACEVDA